MIISHIQIKNYRSLKEVSFDSESYLSIIGANGAGKSSVLYALDWFFGNRVLESDDITLSSSITMEEEPRYSDEEIEVILTFEYLTPDEKIVFENYIFEDKLVIAKIGHGTTYKYYFEGKLDQSFSDLQNKLAAGSYTISNTNFRLYTKLRANEEYNSLPELSSADHNLDVEKALLDWSRKTRKQLFIEFHPSLNLESLIKKTINFILIPAVPNEQDLKDNKSSLINGLVNAITSEENATHKEALEETSQAQRKEDEGKAKELDKKVETALSEHLNRFLPGQKVNFHSNFSRPQPKIEWSFSIGKEEFPLAHQGHGIQRAILMALLQASKASNSQTTIIAVEEPEIYQHPIKTKFFARTLFNWVEESKIGTHQLICATHSPYFIFPEKLSSIRLFRLDQDKNTVISSTNIKEVAILSKTKPESVEKCLMRELPNEFSEIFFSDAAVLVEGDTDKAILEGLAEKEFGEGGLSGKGISIISLKGNGGLNIPHKICKVLGIPTYIIFDADQAKKGKGTGTEASLENFKSQFGIGASEFSWSISSTTVHDEWCIFEGDLEGEISSLDSFYHAWHRIEHEEEKDRITSQYETAISNGTDPSNPSLVKLKSRIESVYITSQPSVQQKKDFETKLRASKNIFWYKHAAKTTNLSSSDVFYKILNSIQALGN